MKYSGHFTCKVCGKSWQYKSNHFPFEVVDWFYRLLFFCHLIAHHRQELDLKKTMVGLYQILLRIVLAVVWVVLTILEIIFYPVKLLVDLLY